MPPDSLIFDKSEIQRKLFALDSPKRIKLKGDEFFTKSAILFTIIRNDTHPYKLLLIHRTDRGTKHRNEISFPGGRHEPETDVSLIDTAIREAMEEIGVSRTDVEILGCMHDFPTLTRYIITPIIGVINKNQRFCKQETEVRRILKIPIDYFADKHNFNERLFIINHKKFPVYYYNYFDEVQKRIYTIWGATAHMIQEFLHHIYSVQLSESGIKRFTIEKIKNLKNNLKFKRKLSNGFNPQKDKQK
ncbi:MAG: CoA pyrophosphatase [Promethearchaeia archaeon]